MKREARLAALLLEACEWLNGCRGSNTNDPDEPCDCEECEVCTDLLTRISNELETDDDEA